MIYNLLKRIQNLLASKPSGTKEEQEILSLVSRRFLQCSMGMIRKHLPPMSCWYGYAPTPNGRSSYAITATAVPVPAQWDDGRGCRRRGLMAAFQR